MGVGQLNLKLFTLYHLPKGMFGFNYLLFVQFQFRQRILGEMLFSQHNSWEFQHKNGSIRVEFLLMKGLQ